MAIRRERWDAQAMTLLGLVVTIVVVGFLLWLLTKYVPMEPMVRQILVAVVVIVLALWILSALGVLGALDRPIRVR